MQRLEEELPGRSVVLWVGVRILKDCTAHILRVGSYHNFTQNGVHIIGLNFVEYSPP